MIIVLLSIGVAGGTTFYLSWNLFSGALEDAAAGRLEQGQKNASTGLLKLTRPLFKALVMPYSQKLKLEDWKKNNKRRIVSAGLENALDVDELLAFKIFMGIVVPLAIYTYFLVTGSPIPLWLMAGMMLIGLFIQVSWSQVLERADTKK